MRRRDLDYIVVLAMLVSGLYVTVTGLMADVLGLHQVALHSYAGYAWAGLALAHTVLNGGRIVTYLRGLNRRLLGRRREQPAAEERQGAEAAAGRRQIMVATLSAAAGFVAGRWFPGGRQDLPGDAADIGALYHKWSTPGAGLGLLLPDWGSRPPRYKTYPNVSRVELPYPRGFRGLSVEEALEARRSIRDYAGQSIALADLSRLLQAAQGITEERRELRAAPSAGALYPIEIYPVVHRVEALVSGVYHYAVQSHELECLQKGDFRGDVTEAGLHQRFLGQSNVVFLLSAIFQRTRWKYRERAYRYVLLEAGHIAQNLYLAASSMGLGACAVGAFYDGQYNELLGLDGEEEATLYVISVGARG